MKTRTGSSDDRFKPALEAIGNLLLKELNEVFNGGWTDGLSAHFNTEQAPINGKSAAFYRHLLPLRQSLVSVLADSYRKLFKLALAHPHQTGRDPHGWAVGQLDPAIRAAIEWIFGWYIQACDGVQPLASTDFIPGQTVSLSIPTTIAPAPPPESWRAPAWLFQISMAYFGIGPLKTKHVPHTDSNEKLGAAHTRLLLKGARRVFLWELGTAIENVRNEETAAAGAIPFVTVDGEQTAAGLKRPKHWLTGTQGLGPKKRDLSGYMHGLTDKQQLAASLKWEYELKLPEIASRMGIARKTASEHIDAAQKRIAEVNSGEKRKANRAKLTPE